MVLLWNGLQHDVTLLASLFTCASLSNQLPLLAKFTDSPYNHQFAVGVQVFPSRCPGIHLDWIMDFWVAVDCSISPNSILSRYLNNNLIQNWILNKLIEKGALLSVQIWCVTAGVSERGEGSSLHTSCSPRQGYKVVKSQHAFIHFLLENIFLFCLRNRGTHWTASQIVFIYIDYHRSNNNVIFCWLESV